jgi:ribosomal protein S18 acetylase RimI-like enzyme
MTAVRAMREEDADAVRLVDTAAFWAWEKQVRGDRAQQYRRTRTNVLACREKDPGGCFVAEEGGRPVGFVFSRTWGGVGWLGTFAVLPEHQGRGIGKRLIAASLEYLRQDPDRVIGLETMFDSPYNLGLYLHLGFEARSPILLLGKALQGTAARDVGLPRWSSAEPATREQWLANLREATQSIYYRLDYSKEITSVDRHAAGETLVLAGGSRAIGFSTVRLVSTCEEQGHEQASLEVAALHPAYTGEAGLRALISASEVLARGYGKERLVVPVNGRHTWAVRRMLELGYRVERAGVRMVLKGTDDGPSGDHWVDFSRWAG